METADVRRALRLLEPAKAEGLSPIDDALFLLVEDRTDEGGKSSMSAWRRSLFIARSRLSAVGTEYFNPPQDRDRGGRIEV
jgi:K+ transporter